MLANSINRKSALAHVGCTDLNGGFSVPGKGVSGVVHDGGVVIRISSRRRHLTVHLLKVFHKSFRNVVFNDAHVLVSVPPCLQPIRSACHRRLYATHCK